MSGSFTDSNTTATGETNEPVTFGGGNLNTIWYNWTAPASGTFTAQTCSATITTFDTTLKAYSGTALNALATLVSNDDACANTSPNLWASLVSFSVTAGTNYKIQVDGYGSGTGTYLFTYNLPPPTLTIANTTNGAEAAAPTNGVMTITQSAISTTNTVIAYTVGGTASSGSDYTALSGTVTILAGATTATITIPVLDDSLVEGPETASVTLTSVTSGVAILGATVLATNTIADDDVSTVSIANITNAAEPATVGTLRLTLTKASATATTVSYTVAGTATPGTDYTSIATSVVIPANTLTFDISVAPVDDAIVEGPETDIVTLTAATSNALITASGNATNTIADNDVATLTLGTPVVNEATGTALYPVTLSKATASGFTIAAATSSGTATSGSDFTAASLSLTFAGTLGEVQNISVPITDDLLVEGSEAFNITLSALSNSFAGALTFTAGAQSRTIADNDVSTVSIANITDAAEPATAGTLRLTLTKASVTATTVSYTVTGTATSGTDYTSIATSVVVPANTLTFDISIAPIDDASVEGPETVIVTLAAATSNALITASGNATNTIADNDVSTVSIANITNAAEPATAGTLRLTLTKVSATATTVSYTVAGSATSGTDYTSIGTSVVVPANTLTFDISVAPIDDAIVEGSETVIVTLTTATSNALITASGNATNTIADNDISTASIANTTNGAEAVVPTNGVMTVSLTAASATNTVVTYTVSGTATTGSDYTALSGSVTILAGFTSAIITIPVIDNLVVEPSETVIITLTAISGLPTLGAPLVATNTISDNDVASFTISKAVNLANVTAPGTLNYTITIASAGNVPLTSPVLTDVLANGSALTLTSGPTLISGDAAPLGTLDAGETWVYAATYAVTQANINLGASITNKATFSTAEASALTSNTVTTTITQNPHLKITKSASTHGPVPVNTVITYTYTVLNDGNITMTAVAVADTHNGSGTLVGPTNESLTTDVAPTLDTTDAAVNGSWDSIGPGDTVTFTATYTVTQNDVDTLQ